MENQKPTTIEWIASGLIIFTVFFLFMTTAAYTDHKCFNEDGDYYKCITK